MDRRQQVALYYARKKRRAKVDGTPVESAAPVITGVTEVGETLTCSEGDWSNTPTMFKYVWRRDGVIIPGATFSTYDLGALDEDAMINCTVRAGNVNGFGGSTSESVGPVTAA